MSLINRSRRLGHLTYEGVNAFNKERKEAVEESAKRLAAGKKIYQSTEPLFEGKVNEGAASEVQHHVFGLMLPSGRSTDVHQLHHDIDVRFQQIEEVYKEYFGITEEELAQEDDDDESEDAQTWFKDTDCA